MNALKAGMLATLLGLVPAAAVQATPSIGHVVVTAPTTTGGTIVCRGEACAGILRSLQGSSFNETETSFFEDLPPVSLAEFCRLMKANKPQGCNRASPPSVPRYNPTWQANGCGRGALDRVIAGLLIPRVYRDYSGNLNAPYNGVSFLEACNGHDRCWADGGDRSSCDMIFRTAMSNACAGDSRCETYASAYHASVGTNAATSTYNAGLAAYACAEWVANLDGNGCSA